MTPGRDTSASFREAARDYLFMASRGYSDKALLKLIGDRYQLLARERSRLFRGIFTEAVNAGRKARMGTFTGSGSQGISIDGFNVLYTLISYLTGKDVYIATDGFVRDSAEVHGKPYRESLRLKAWDLTLAYLVTVRPAWVSIYLDEPISGSGQMAALVRDDLGIHHIDGTATTVKSADHWIAATQTGFIATSDGVLIDRSLVPVTDLAADILRYHYQPELPDLSEFVA